MPLVGAIIGEGGSGGAVALAVADRVLMLEHAVYSVISPEGCAAILWRSGEQAPAAAEAMRLTAQDLHQLGVVDQIIPEPLGGAHRAPGEAIAAVGDALERRSSRSSRCRPPNCATVAAKSSWPWATAPCSERGSLRRPWRNGGGTVTSVSSGGLVAVAGTQEPPHAAGGRAQNERDECPDGGR